MLMAWLCECGLVFETEQRAFEHERDHGCLVLGECEDDP